MDNLSVWRNSTTSILRREEHFWPQLRALLGRRLEDLVLSAFAGRRSFSAAAALARAGGPVEPKGAQYRWAFFNLKLPLKPQLETVGRMLTEAQKRQGIKPRRIKHHRQLWPLYLMAAQTAAAPAVKEAA